MYDAVCEVPAGSVTTYGDVAAAVGHPRRARQVGWALAALDHDGVPWHRVINHLGSISIADDTGRATLQRALLEAEGLVFDARGRVDLARRRWRWPDRLNP